MAKFEKGHTRVGGKQKGTKNHKTNFIEACDALNFNVLACLIEGLNQMPPFQQVEYLTKILEYYYPKQRNVEVGTGENGFKIMIEDYSQKK